MYALEITTGNGYHCSCCRQTWKHTEDFDTIEQAMARIAQIEHTKENFKRLRELGLCGEDEDDTYIGDFYEYNSLPRDEAMIAKCREALTAELKAKEVSAAEVKRLEKEEKARQREIDKRSQYEKLKAEFEK